MISLFKKRSYTFKFTQQQWETVIFPGSKYYFISLPVAKHKLKYRDLNLTVFEKLNTGYINTLFIPEQDVDIDENFNIKIGCQKRFTGKIEFTKKYQY